MVPPEEDLQTYKRSLVRFRNITASGSHADKLQHSTLKFSLEKYWANTNNINLKLSMIYLSIYLSSAGRGGPAGVQEPGRALHRVRVAGAGGVPPLSRRYREHAGPHGQGPAQAAGLWFMQNCL